jgi:hypothetical protein
MTSAHALIGEIAALLPGHAAEHRERLTAFRADIAIAVREDKRRASRAGQRERDARSPA